MRVDVLTCGGVIGEVATVAVLVCFRVLVCPHVLLPSSVKGAGVHIKYLFGERIWMEIVDHSVVELNGRRLEFCGQLLRDP